MRTLDRDRHATAPYADALRSLAATDLQRLHVPAHQGRAGAAPGVAALLGPQPLALDVPMGLAAIDQESWEIAAPGRPTPLAQAQDLAAEAWGARRTWFLTNGASGGNHVATTVARALGREIVVQRSVHASVVDGIAHVGLEPHFLAGAVDAGLGAAHGVTADEVERALTGHPRASAVYVVSPSYFGAVADVAAIAGVAHAHGVPLIVDEAWGSHFGLHASLPANAVRLGADLVISSTHKGAGSLTQSAMLHLGHGPHAREIEALVARVVASYSSTSTSALLLASLDEARRHLAVDGWWAIPLAVASAEEIRRGVRESGRFRDATPDLLAAPGTVAVDPLKVAIDTRGAGISGGQARHHLLAHDRVSCELATPAALLLAIGATTRADPARFLRALAALPRVGAGAGAAAPELPAAGERVLGVQDAFFAATAVVPFPAAVGEVSTDSLAAYPPGIPNVLPGEVLTADVVAYLRATATTPSGFVRGAHDPRLDGFRVVRRPAAAIAS